MARGEVIRKMSRDPLATDVSTPEPPESLRLQLADLWPDERPGSDGVNAPLMTARNIPNPPDRPQCADCTGDLVRSRLRLYERVLARFTKARPYRCLDCRARRWR